MGKDSFSFNVQRKKTPFQRHKELEEDKKRRADAEAAKLYEEFVQSFGDGGEGEGGGAAPRAFVRGGTIQPGSSAAAAVAAAAVAGASAKRGRYVPSFLPPAMAAAAAAAAPVLSTPRPALLVAAMPEREPAPASGGSARGKVRNIDVVLENLKKEQEAREERQRMRRERGAEYDPTEDGGGSFDEGDPFTTNLYVGNLAPDVDEEVLKREFVRFGNIASVKIMWPRDDLQRMRARNCGFVAFMTRPSADRAMAELNGAMLHDLELKIGWGKAVQLPPEPLYTATNMAAGGAARGVAVPPPGAEAAPPWADPHAAEPASSGPDIVVEPPRDGRARFLIDALAAYVDADGAAFESAVMSAKAGNPEFGFLFDLRAPEHAYYRWRLFSLASGDTLRAWRVEPFIMVEGGPKWVPPPMTVTAAGGSHQTAAQRGGEVRDKDRPLPDVQRDRFEDLLRALTVERADIREAMVFALDNADCAAEVVEVLTDSLTLSETPVPAKAARLLLVSDVLHNSTAPVRNASRYRSLLEASLPDIFESLQMTYRSVDGRMAQEALRRHVLRLLRVWRSWFIFSDDFLNGLQATFLRGPSMAAAPDAALQAELEALPLEALETRCRRSGLSRRGSRADMETRLLALHAYLNGDKAEPPPPPLAASADAGLAAQLAVPAAPSVFDVNLGSEPAAAATGDSNGAASTQPHAAEEGPARRGVGALEQPEAAAVAEAGVVSKWTLVDYDDEGAGHALAPESSDDDIFSDAAADTTTADAPAAARRGASPAPDPLAEPPQGLGSGLGKPSPALDEPATARRASGAAAGGESGAADVMDEERRARLRQVEVATMRFRDSLEEAGGMDRAVLEAAVAAEREKLLAAAERAAAAATGDPRPSVDPKDGGDGDRGGARLQTRSGSGREASGRGGRERERDSNRKDTSERDRAPERGRERGNRDRGRGDHNDRRARDDVVDRHDREKRDRTRDRSRGRTRDRSRERRPHEEPSRERLARDQSRERSRERQRSDSRQRVDSRERSRERQRERDRNKETPRLREKDREREKKEKEKEKAREKEMEREKEKDRDKEQGKRKRARGDCSRSRSASASERTEKRDRRRKERRK
ncbi:hypothetical protein WJX81_005170 [Elliptochloris bilobata]|uniref:U2 snRNP-associated SURP motif-containing protein n=1 Tax=Elliptochloris bilobata TaxID=381761 RepID=A0AAW1QVM0_9CHLO